MIIIKIERWPDNANPSDPAEERRPHTDIAKAVIRNDHSGSAEAGNYDVELYDPPAYNPWAGVTLQTKVENFPRRELGAWDLLYRALGQVIGDRNDGASEPGASSTAGSIAEYDDEVEDPTG